MGTLKPFIFWIKSKEKYTVQSFSVWVRAFHHLSTTKYHACLVIRGNNLTPLVLNQSQTASTKHTWLAALNFPRLVPDVFLSVADGGDLISNPVEDHEIPDGKNLYFLWAVFVCSLKQKQKKESVECKNVH